MLNKIKAIGNVYGIKLEFEVYFENEKMIINTTENDDFTLKLLRDRFETCMEEKKRVIGGTYHPADNTLLAVYLVLEDDFFDNKDFKIDVIGKLEEIPYEEGVIY